MPKRRRLLNSPIKKHKSIEFKPEPELEDKTSEREVRSARGRLMGALLEALEGDSSDEEPQKRLRHRTPKKPAASSEDQGQYSKQYVLKLFDRSVDLSQFEEDSPLYPICRAWIANQPKANYKELLCKKEEPEGEDKPEVILELPGPEGPYISRIPELLPEQKARNKNDINLDYDSSSEPPLTREQLLNFHLNRWSAVRQAWLEQSALVESRYTATQEVLNKISNLK